MRECDRKRLLYILCTLEKRVAAQVTHLWPDGHVEPRGPRPAAVRGLHYKHEGQTVPSDSNLDSAQTFSSSLRLLESKLQVRGHYDHPDADHLKTAVQMTFTQPSGETFTSDLHLSHAYDGSVRDIKASSTYNGDVIEGLVKSQTEMGGSPTTHADLHSPSRHLSTASEGSASPLKPTAIQQQVDSQSLNGTS
nr:uncharacterized protein LOC113810709 [Penaeus vannamei]